MKPSPVFAATLTLLAAVIGSIGAVAGTTEAVCEFRRDGEVKKGASGPCTISQRAGYVDIDLRDGRNYSLSPSERAGHYRDQGGNKVVLAEASGRQHVYKWENKRVIVTFSGAGAAPDTARPPGGRKGETPPDLRDLVGKNARAAENQLFSRGYELVRTSMSGAEAYGNWRQRSTGQCVTVHQVDKRFESIVYSRSRDCS